VLCAVFWSAEGLLRVEGKKSDSEILDDLRFRGLRVSCGSGEAEAEREHGGLTGRDCAGMAMRRSLSSSSMLSGA
jgi:hypothetical protein